MGATVETVMDNSQLVLSSEKEAVIRALTTIGMLAERYAKMECPVDTGRLRNSISWAVLDNSVYIGTNVEYAPYVELGTSKQKAQPYLKPAVEKHVSQYKRVVESEMRKG